MTYRTLPNGGTLDDTATGETQTKPYGSYATAARAGGSGLTTRMKAYSKLIRGLMMAAAGLYELVFDEDAPRPSDALRG